MTTLLATAPVTAPTLPIPPMSRAQLAKALLKMRVMIHVDTEVFDPEVARRKANVWLLMNAGHLFGAEHPKLILENQELLWRYDVLLTSPRGGVVGRAGSIHVRATSGEVVAHDTMADELMAAADQLVATANQPFGQPLVTHKADEEVAIHGAPVVVG